MLSDTPPALWPTQAPGSPQLVSDHDGDQTYEADDWTLAIRHRAGVKVAQFRSVPGSILGQPHGFGLELLDDGWYATALCDTFRVDIEGTGDAPERFDLRAIAP